MHSIWFAKYKKVKNFFKRSKNEKENISCFVHHLDGDHAVGMYKK